MRGASGYRDRAGRCRGPSTAHRSAPRRTRRRETAAVRRSATCTTAALVTRQRASVPASSRTRCGRTSQATIDPCAPVARAERQRLAARRRAEVEHALRPAVRRRARRSVARLRPARRSAPRVNAARAERADPRSREARVARVPVGSVVDAGLASSSASASRVVSVRLAARHSAAGWLLNCQPAQRGWLAVASEPAVDQPARMRVDDREMSSRRPAWPRQRSRSATAPAAPHWRDRPRSSCPRDASAPPHR